MLLKYFYNQPLAHASYMVGCQATGEALIIDPGRDVEIYLRAAEREGLRLVGAAETHIHADFVSGSRELAARTGARLYLSDEGDADWKYLFLQEYAHQLLRDGDTFMIGNIRFDVMHTPGHTPEHIAFILTDTAGADRPMGIFTGDFVFVGSVGRPDLLEKAAGIANTSVAGARQMFHSLRRFKELPDYLQVWPAHGAGSACGRGLGAVPSSTVGYEKLFNGALGYEDEEAFVAMLLQGQPEPPYYFAVMKQVNKEGPRVLHALPQLERLPASRISPLLDQNSSIIDTRNADAFAAMHIPGTINIPAADLAEWAGWLLNYREPFYLIIDADGREAALRDLIYIGLDNVGGYFEIEAVKQWRGMGHPVQSYQMVTPDQIADQVRQGQVRVIDVRAQTEWDEGHLPGAQHIMLGTLPARAHELVNGETLLVNCLSGSRSAIGVSILQARGAANVINLTGGIRDWAACGLPLEN